MDYDKIKIINLFKKHDDEYRKFDRVKNPLSTRRDLACFLLLDKLFHKDEDIIEFAEHDEIILSIPLEKLAMVVTEEDIVTLIRCGIIIDENENRLFMYY